MTEKTEPEAVAMDVQDISTPPVVVKDPIAVRNRLAELGLTPELVWETAVAWSRAEAMQSAFEPRNAPGTKGWIASTGYFREQMVLAGWVLKDPYGIPITFNEQLGLSLSVTSGNELTGLDLHGRSPTTKNPKGTATVARILRNAKQVEMWVQTGVDPGGELRRAKKAAKRPVSDLIWLVLVFVDTKHDVIRVEVSMPAGITRRKVDVWAERILVTAPSNEPIPQKRGHDNAPSLDGEVLDVPVERRSA